LEVIVFKNFFRNKTQQMIGLDIGTRFVKAVLLEKDNHQFKVQSIACEAIIGNAFVEREVKDFEAVSLALKKVKKGLKNKCKNVAIAVSGSSVLSKVVFMDPDQSDFELESQIELEADSLIPYPLDEVYIDFEELGPSATNNSKVDVLLSAAHKDIVDKRITLLGEVGYEAKVIDVESYSLGSALIQHYPENAGQALVCINIGASHLQCCAVKEGRVIYVKEHAFGLDPLIQELGMLYTLDRSEVEIQLHAGSLPENWKQDVYPLFLSNLAQQVTRAIQMYATTTMEEQPVAILISGGGSNLINLDKDLAAELAIEVEVFNPFSDMQIGAKIEQQEFMMIAPQFAIAAGLASRSFSPWHI
jgi:type IV pilus assembly protein PilM